MTSNAAAVTSEQRVLGEGVRWDARRDELLHIDIVKGQVFRHQVDGSGALSHRGMHEVPGTVGALAPVEGDDGWILAAGRGFAYLPVDGEVRPIAEVSPPDTRMNDGACDPAGRFFAGTVADGQREGGAALYRLDPDGSVHAVLDGLTISNGLGWSPAGDVMYLCDSGPGVVLAFDFDVDDGAMSNARVLIDVPDDLGAPDGMTVDANGDLWVAIWGGGRVHRYSPDGTLREVHPIPARETTSCGFGGPSLSWLYVTTGTENWDDEHRRAEPNAGLVYRIETDTTGMPAAHFRPDPGWWRTITG